MNIRKRRRLTRPKGPPEGSLFVRLPQGEYEARHLVERGLRRTG